MTFFQLKGKVNLKVRGVSQIVAGIAVTLVLTPDGAPSRGSLLRQIVGLRDRGKVVFRGRAKFSYWRISDVSVHPARCRIPTQSGALGFVVKFRTYEPDVDVGAAGDSVSRVQTCGWGSVC